MTKEYDEMRDRVETEKEKKQAATLAMIAETNARIFQRECAAAGVNPAGGVSPALLKILKEQRR